MSVTLEDFDVTQEAAASTLASLSQQKERIGLFKMKASRLQQQNSIMSDVACLWPYPSAYITKASEPHHTTHDYFNVVHRQDCSRRLTHVQRKAALRGPKIHSAAAQARGFSSSNDEALFDVIVNLSGSFVVVRLAEQVAITAR